MRLFLQVLRLLPFELRRRKLHMNIIFLFAFSSFLFLFSRLLSFFLSFKDKKGCKFFLSFNYSPFIFKLLRNKKSKQFLQNWALTQWRDFSSSARNSYQAYHNKLSRPFLSKINIEGSNWSKKKKKQHGLKKLHYTNPQRNWVRGYNRWNTQYLFFL